MTLAYNAQRTLAYDAQRTLAYDAQRTLEGGEHGIPPLR